MDMTAFDMIRWMVSGASTAAIAVIFLMPESTRQNLFEQRPEVVMSLFCAGAAGFSWIAFTSSLG